MLLHLGAYILVGIVGSSAKWVRALKKANMVTGWSVSGVGGMVREDFFEDWKG